VGQPKRRATVASRVAAPEDHSAQSAWWRACRAQAVGLPDGLLLALYVVVVVQQVALAGAVAAVAGVMV
jgi:hypothetical protein